MKAVKVRISSDVLLKALGFNPYDYHQLKIYGCKIEGNAELGDNEIDLFITGTHPDLPEVKIGEIPPEAVIKYQRIDTRIEVPSK